MTNISSGDENDTNKKDVWEKTKIIGQVLTPVAIAVIGIWFNVHQARRDQNAVETEVYTRLLSSREAAESDLRKDLFPQMVRAFFAEASTSGLEDRLLNLELMAGNFHDSINLKPLFNQVHTEIRNKLVGASQQTAEETKPMKERLERLADNIRETQLAVVMESKQYDTRSLLYEKYLRSESSEVLMAEPFLYTLELDGYVSKIALDVTAIDPVREEARVRLTVDTYRSLHNRPYMSKTVTSDNNVSANEERSFPGDQKEIKQFVSNRADDDLVKVTTSQAELWVGAYDFPMISNVRLPMNQRCAVVLKQIDTEAMKASFSVVLFRGRQASLKEKPYIDEVIRKLLRQDDTSGL